MVGGLVEQQQIGLGEQRRGERDAHPPAAREARERPVLGVLVEAQAVQDRARPRRRGVGADVGEPGLDLGDGVRVLDPLGRRQELRPLAVGGEHRRARARFAARRLLGNPADARAAAQPHLARIRPDLAADQPEQRGLAAAIAADQPDAMPRRDVNRGALEQQLAADTQADVVQMQHGAGA